MSQPVGILLCWFLLLAVGCKSRETGGTAIARIDNETLTLEQIRSRFDTSRGVSQAQLQQYVQRWLTDELLFREAVRRGLDRTDVMTTRLEEIRRQLAITALLDQEIYTDSTERAGDDEVAAYFESHKPEFVLQQDVALVSYVLFSDRDGATAFRNTVLKGTSWHQALTQVNDPGQSILTASDSAYYTQATLHPTELWRVAVNSPGHAPSFPVNTPNGYYILIVWKFSRQGDQADAQYMAREIRGRIAIEKRKRLYNTLVENLRARHSVEVFMSPSGPDSLKFQE